MTETITTKQLAAILGISVQRVNELGRKGKIERESDGGWDLVKVNAALRRNLDRHQAIRSLGQKTQPGTGETNGDAGDSFSEAQRKHEWLKVQKDELMLQVRRGELLEAAEIEETWTRGFTAIKNNLLLIADKLAPKLAVCSDERECRALVFREISRSLEAAIDIKAHAA